MTGVHTSLIYRGLGGSVHKEHMLAGDQYRATRHGKRGPQSRYFARSGLAIRWLLDQAAKEHEK
jgi:hypothetical protein